MEEQGITRAQLKYKHFDGLLKQVTKDKHDHWLVFKNRIDYYVRCAFSGSIFHSTDVNGSHACSLKATRRETNVISLGWPLSYRFAL
jgi:hypothetical protein